MEQGTGRVWTHVRCRLHGHKAFYVVNRQINYTNVCVNGCTFCAFRRDAEDEPGAFVLSLDDVLARLRAADATPLHLDELHIVGGCHPTRPLAWFEEMIRAVRAFNPNLPVKAFTAVEIEHFARLEGISTLEVLKRLQNAGLVMMPGGGAEIFDETLRPQICPHKADAKTWLRIQGEAHSLGIATNCTMLVCDTDTFAYLLPTQITAAVIAHSTETFSTADYAKVGSVAVLIAIAYGVCVMA